MSVPRTRLAKATRKIELEKIISKLEEKLGCTRYTQDFLFKVISIIDEVKVDGHNVCIETRPTKAFGEVLDLWFFVCDCGAHKRTLYSPDGLPYMCDKCHKIKRDTGTKYGFGPNVIKKLDEIVKIKNDIESGAKDLEQGIREIKLCEHKIKSSLLYRRNKKDLEEYIKKNG